MLCHRTENAFERIPDYFFRLVHSKIPAIVLTAVVALLASGAAMAQVISTDFEDGGTDGWFGFGGATVSNSTVQASSGIHSLLATNRTATYQGPGIDLTTTLAPGQSYVFKVAVRLSDTTPGSDNVNMTMLNTVNGSTGFAHVAGSTVTNTGWVVLQGAYTPPSSGVSQLILYVEDDTNANAEYYIDAFTVSTTNGGCTNPPDTSGFFSGFESGTNEGWVSRGGGAPVTLTPTQADAHSGSWSLLVQGRTAFWNGPTHDITGKMCNGSQYWLEAWVKLAPGEPTTTINMSLQLTDQFGNVSFPGVTNATVTSGGWVRLKSKPYTFSGSYTNLQIYLQSGFTTPVSQFYVDDVKVQYLPPPVIENIRPIDQAYAGDFLVGFAAGLQDISGPHGQLAALHYNSVTPGNDLKWSVTEPSEGNFQFGNADAILAFAQAHNIKMRGHNFVWHNQVPNWVFQDANGMDMSTEPFSQANKQLLLSRLQNHINALIQHYQGSIYVWDVVNEAIDESQADGFRRTKWYTITQDPTSLAGTPPEYMDDAFIYARQALDAVGAYQVKLCYNDYNTTIPAKRNFIYNWVKGAISRGVPIDCVGNQFHNTINFPIDDFGSASSRQSVIDTLNLFASLKSNAPGNPPIVNEVTEFDMSLYRYGQCSQPFFFDYDDLLAGDTVDLINQGYRYRDYFQIFKSLKSEIDSVTIWGLGDDDSWLNPNVNAAGCQGITAADAPLPFSSYLQHKYAYTGMVNPLALPGANLVTTVAASSGTPVSGQNVSFVATVTNNGPNDAANLTFTEAVPARTHFVSFSAPTGWTCTLPKFQGSGQASCTAAALTNGSTAQFTMTVLTTIPGAGADSATVSSTTLNPNPIPQTTASVNYVVVGN